MRSIRNLRLTFNGPTNGLNLGISVHSKFLVPAAPSPPRRTGPPATKTNLSCLPGPEGTSSVSEPILSHRCRVLFLCTGNSCRSQMAEGWLRPLAGHRFESLSAGANPAGYIHPPAVQVM